MPQVACNYVPSWQLFIAETLRNLGTYHQVFCVGAGTATTIEQVILTELLEINGYNRKVYSPATSTYNAINKRAEAPSVNNSLVAAGSSLQYDSTALLFNASINANKPFLSTDVSAPTSTITVAAHGLVNGEAIMLTADPGSTLAANLSSTTLYYAANVTANTFQASTTADGSSIITLGSAGSGTMRLRYAKGRLVIVGNYGDIQTILDGASRTITTYGELHNSGYTAGV